MNEIRLIALVSFVAIFTTACGGGDGGGSSSGSGNDDVTTPVEPSSPTMAKDILFTELMIDPVNIPDFNGEWFEIKNPGTDKLNLMGCVFSNSAVIGFSINFELIIEAGEYLTFAISDIPGFDPDFNYNSGLILNNLADTLTLTCSGIAIDSRQYTMSSSGRSSSLSNNGPAMWCDDRGSIYGLGDSGTPGKANINCP